MIDQHAELINRTRQASMLLPGQNMLLMEVAPALFGAHMVNVADLNSLEKAKAHVEKSLCAIPGRA